MKFIIGFKLPATGAPILPNNHTWLYVALLIVAGIEPILVTLA